MRLSPESFKGTGKFSRATTVQEAAEEAAQQLHAKRQKVETGLAALYLKDHAILQRADREKVRQLEKRRLGIDTGGGDDDVGDIIVTDDIHYTASPVTDQSRRGGLGKLLGGALLGGALVGGPLAYLLSQAVTAPAPVVGEDTDTALTLEFAGEQE